MDLRKKLKNEITYSNMWPRYPSFLKSLNWTLVWYQILGMVTILLLLLPYLDSPNFPPLLGIVEVLFYIGFFYLLVWNLKHKGRSLWNILWLLLNIFGIGGIIFLCVKNQTQLRKEAEKEKEKEEKEKYTREWKEKFGYKPDNRK